MHLYRLYLRVITLLLWYIWRITKSDRILDILDQYNLELCYVDYYIRKKVGD